MTATATRQAQRDHAGAHGREGQHAHRDPAEAVGHAEDELERVQARDDPGDEQHRVDRRVREAQVLERAGTTGSSQQAGHRAAAARRPRAASASRSAGHHAWASCSWSACTSAPSAQPGLPDEHHEAVGQAGRAPRRGRARRRPTTPRRARASSVVERALAEVDRAAGAERPAPGPVASHAARRPASQRPSRSRTTHIAAIDRRRVVLDQAQRPAHRLQLEAQLAVRPPRGRRGAPRGRRGWASRGRRSAAIAASAASVRSAGASKCSSRQVACTWSGPHGPRASS